MSHPASGQSATVDTVYGRTERRLGGFRLLHRLGAGGMGSVYLAEHVVSGSRVAVKVLHPFLSSDPSILRRFHDEARAVNLIGHDNILRIHDLCQEGELHYLIMEYLEGQPLSKLTLPLPKELAVPILAQVCDALAAAHDHGVVHRDLKPENVFLLERGGRLFVKLLDFGIAKLLQAASSVTATGLVLGTPSHMAPEQFRGDPIDGRADIYSLGVLSYQLSTGVLPFATSPLGSLIRGHLEVAPTPPATLHPSVDRRWSEITLRALSKRPEDRYQYARAMRADLLAMLRAPPLRPEPTSIPPPAAPRPSRPLVKVDVLAADETTLRTASGSELSKDGVLLATPGFRPPLFSTLRIALRGPAGDELRLECEVVRHVNADQAQAWGMSEGVAVQFLHRTDAQKRALAALVKGEPIPADALAPSASEPGPDPEVVLKPLRRRAAVAGSDPYLLLNLPSEAYASDVKSRAREVRQALQGCQSPRATREQRAEVMALQDRLERAEQTLLDPVHRAEFDAARGNYMGVARAIAAGISVTELERLRRQFQVDHPHSTSRAVLEVTCAHAYEQQEDLQAAAHAYERALRHDPLDLSLHQRLSRIRRQRMEQGIRAAH